MFHRKMKWSWADFGINLVCPDMIAEPSHVLKWLSFPDADSVEVRFYESLGRAVVIVAGCNEPLHVSRETVYHASRESGWDVDILTDREFEDLLRTALQEFRKIDGLSDDVGHMLVQNGYFGLDDLSIIDPDWFSQNANIEPNEIDDIIAIADKLAEESGGDGI